MPSIASSVMHWLATCSPRKSAVFASSQPVDLPLVGITKLDGAAHDGAILSSGECSAVFDDGRTSQSFLPFARNDLGMDLAAYSSDGETTFDIQGLSEQRRTLRIEGWEVQYPTLGSARIRSSVSLAGALIVLAEPADAGKREAWAKRGAAFFKGRARRSSPTPDRDAGGAASQSGSAQPASGATGAA